jgi:DNA-binding SARP family transcriptional activator
MSRLVPENAGAVADVWPWPLKISTLGRFELFKDDKPVVFAGRVQQKPLTMLKALVAFGGKDVSEEKIIDALWPDADGDVAHTSFDTTLHRLRRLVNNDNAIVLRDGRVSLDERYCWVDTRAFERALCNAEEAWKQDGQGHEEAVHLTEKAVNIYKGHFLPRDTKEPWTISPRERLRAKFMYGISKLGRYWVEAGRYDKAVQVFQDGLEIDDLAEEFYQHLMVCYNQLGQQTEAVKVYNRCRSVLQSSLGLKPSSKTEGFYYVIRQGA